MGLSVKYSHLGHIWMLPKALHLVLLVVLIQFVNPVQSEMATGEIARAKNDASRQFLLDLLENMDPRIRPIGEDYGPVVTKVNMYVISFSDINEISMDFKTNIFFREFWKDPRLTWEEGPEHISLPSRYVDQIWTPDLYFPNEKAAKFHDVTVPNRLLKVFRDGTVKYSVQVTLTLSCPMELASFPMDTQVCAIKVESYGYEMHEMVLQWQNTPVEIDDELELPQFELGEIHNDTCLKTYKTTGSFPCLKVTFTLYRHFGFFLLQTYIPSILIIILSWVSFWINMDAVPARISLGVTTVLTMTTQLSGSKASIPKVSYPKAIDIWMSMGMIFVFAALVEYAFVNAMSRRHSKMEMLYKKTDGDNDCNNDKSKCPEYKDEDDGCNNEQLEMTGHKNPSPRSDKSRGLVRRRNRVNYRNVAHNIDKVSRFVFPVTFLIFNIVYWPFYLIHR